MPSGGHSRSGRKPTPTRLRVLRGNPGRRPLNPAEPAPARGVPEPPEWLNLLELEAWDTLTAALEPMGVVTISDGPALTALAVAWADWRQARAVLDLEEHYPEAGDGLRKHPAAGVASEAWRRVASMLAEFGLTPSARSRLEVGACSDPDQFEYFLGKRRNRE
jgi:P27 family predicted phage terminase small subunit